MFWFFWVLSIICLVFEELPFLSLLVFVIYWVKAVKKVAKGEFVAIDLFFIFLSVYLFVGVALYSFSPIQELLCKYVDEGCLVISMDDKRVIVINYLLYLLPSYLSLTIKALPFSKSKFGYQKSKVLGVFTTFFLFITLVYAVYLLLITGGKYIFWSGLDGFYFNALGWLVMISSSLIVVSFNHSFFKRSLWFYILPVILVVVLVVLHIRIYAAVIIFSLILNAEIRGYRFNRKSISILFVLFFVVVFQAVTRFSSFDYGDFSNLLFTVLGEFLLPHISTYYLLIDPSNFSPSFGFFDLVTQSLPSAIRPDAGIYKFREMYLNEGVDPWPIGGIFLVGQLNYYFGYMALPMYSLISYLMYRLKSNLLNGKYTILLLMVPPLFMVLPRMELWTARVCLINLVLILSLKFILKRSKG